MASASLCVAQYVPIYLSSCKNHWILSEKPLEEFESNLYTLEKTTYTVWTKICRFFIRQKKTKTLENYLERYVSWKLKDRDTHKPFKNTHKHTHTPHYTHKLKNSNPDIKKTFLKNCNFWKLIISQGSSQFLLVFFVFFLIN